MIFAKELQIALPVVKLYAIALTTTYNRTQTETLNDNETRRSSTKQKRRPKKAGKRAPPPRPPPTFHKTKPKSTPWAPRAWASACKSSSAW